MDQNQEQKQDQNQKQCQCSGGIYVAALLLLCLVSLGGALYAGHAEVTALAGRHPFMLVLVILLAVLDIFALATAFQRGHSSGYAAGLIATATLLPGAATLNTVVIYLAGMAGQFAPLWGLVIAVETWLGVAYFCRGFAKAETAVASSYGELCQRLSQLDAALDALKAGCPKGFEGDLSKATAYEEVRKQREEIKNDLAQGGLSWVLATGYSKVWGRVYRAEEALIEVAPQETVLSAAMYDESRLQGSMIATREELLSKLRQAVAAIDPGAAHFLAPAAKVMAPLTLTTPSSLPEGQSGKPYSQAVLATGGVPPYNWKVTGGEKPAGLEMDPKTGVLSGTQKEAKPFNFTVQVTDSASQMTEKLFTLTFKEPATSPAPTAKPQTTGVTAPTQLPGCNVNTGYAQKLVATGGIEPYRWKLTGGEKPAWLELNEKTGELGGTPTEVKTSSFTVQVADGEGKAQQRDFTLTVYDSATSPPPIPAPPPLTLGSHQPAPVDEKPMESAASAGGIDPKKVARAVLRTVRRSINEFRNASWNGLIVARNHLLETMGYTGMTVFVLLAIAIIWEAPRTSVFGASVFYLVGATMGLFDRLRRESQAEVAIEDYGLSTARLVTIPLFSGLGAVGGVLLVAMLPFSSTVFGPRTPVAAGPSPLTISTPSQLTEGEVAKAARETLQATGGTQPYRWTVSGGAIPDGLLLSPEGALSGTPTNAGTGNFAARVADSSGVTVEKRFALSIKPTTQPTPLAVDTTSPLPEGIVGKGYSERLQAVGGKPPYSWTLKEPRPDWLDLSPAGVLSGNPKQGKTISVTVQVADSDSPKPALAERSFALSVSQSEQSPAVGPQAKPSSEQIPPLVKIFNLGENLIGLLVAAVFGLTPGLLFDRLQQQADRYKADLKSSQATEGTSKG
jgi:hypothetical protein